MLWRLQRIPAIEAALFDVLQEETGSSHYFTLYVTTTEQAALLAVWDKLQETSCDEFLRELYSTPAAPVPPKAPDASGMGSLDRGANAEAISDMEKPDLAPSPGGSDQPAVEQPGTSTRYPPKQELRIRILEDGVDCRRSIRTGLALIKDAEKHDVLGKLARHEASLAKEVARTLSLLHSIRNSGLVHKEEIARREL